MEGRCLSHRKALLHFKYYIVPVAIAKMNGFKLTIGNSVLHYFYQLDVKFFLRQLIAALWTPVGKGLTAWLLFVELIIIDSI